TTLSGGTNDYGIVFQLTPSGTLTTLYAFAGSDGASAYSKLIEGTDGEFYGITSFGGPDFNPSSSSFGNGEVFKITSTGQFTIIHSFALSDGAVPFGGLIKDSAGNLFGTTEKGGVTDNGTVFKLSP